MESNTSFDSTWNHIWKQSIILPRTFLPGMELIYRKLSNKESSFWCGNGGGGDDGAIVAEFEVEVPDSSCCCCRWSSCGACDSSVVPDMMFCVINVTKWTLDNISLMESLIAVLSDGVDPVCLDLLSWDLACWYLLRVNLSQPYLSFLEEKLLVFLLCRGSKSCFLPIRRKHRQEKASRVSYDALRHCRSRCMLQQRANQQGAGKIPILVLMQAVNLPSRSTWGRKDEQHVMGVDHI